MLKLMKDALILCIITLTAGFLLASVYEITKEPIAKAEALAQEKACQEVFVEANTFEEVNTLLEDVNSFISKDSSSNSIDKIMYAYDSSNTHLGYVLQVTNKEGYGGDITFMIGVSKEGTMNGISFLSISETAGLGMNATSENFRDQFKGICAEEITYTKTTATKDNEIDAISGATITTKAVTSGVNSALKAISYLNKEGL